MSSNSAYLPLNEFDVFPFTEKDINNNKERKYKKKLFIQLTQYKFLTRKEKYDSIRKKYKAKFHKTIRKIINKELHKIDSKISFASFPQYFIRDVTKKNNSEAMNKKYEELFDYTYKLYNDQIKKKEEEDDIKKDTKKEKEKEKIIENNEKNKKILEYLNSENIKDKSKLSGWNIIKNMTYSELLDKYFLSKEFEDSIHDMEKNNEKENYINEYISFAKNYTYDFKHNKKGKTKSKISNKDKNQDNKINDNNINTSHTFNDTPTEIKKPLFYINKTIIKDEILNPNENNIFNDCSDVLSLKVDRYCIPRIIEDNNNAIILNQDEGNDEKSFSVYSDNDNDNRYYIE